MNKLYLIFFTALIFFFACDQKNEEMNNNPLLATFNTPFEVPPFDKIMNKHYLPAFKEAIKAQKDEIDAIVNNKEDAAFENTVVALDNSGDILNQVSSVFFPLKSANTNDSINDIAKEVAPLLSKHRDDIALNKGLFQKVKIVYDKKDELDLNAEQSMLLKKIYDRFVRGGANLPEDKKTRFREINERLSMLSLQFGDNLLIENNAFELIVDNESSLAGLPEASIQAAKETAEAKQYDKKWVFTRDH